MNKQKLILATLLTLSVALLSVSLVEAQTIQDYAICYGYGETDLMPKGIGDTVFNYNEKIGLWVQIQNPPDVSYRVIWTDPSGNQYRNVPVEVIEKTGEDWGIVFDSINIAETTAKNKLGVWTVTLYIDGTPEVETQFQIIDYNELLKQISDIQTQIEDIIDEKDALAERNAELEGALKTLQEDYDELQSQVTTSSEYEQLEANYLKLQDDYEALKASQSTTKTMLYGAIIVALVAVVVAVYFGLMKR